MDIKDIAKIIGANYEGKSFDITKINTLSEAKQNEITFVSNPKYIKEISQTSASAIILTKENLSYVPKGCIALVVKNPYWQMAELSRYFAPPIEKDGTKAIVGEGSEVSSKAELASGVIIGKNCKIMAGVYLGCNVKIGDNTILYPNVTIYRDCSVGKNCIIHANSVIGSDGFGFATNEMGEHKKIYQNGNVVIEDDVEIGSCVTIDRAALSSTVIKKGVHIDNLVQIGHNCEIGEYSVIVAQAGISGSTKMGRNVVMGGQSATSGHLSIAPFTTCAARSGVTKSIKTSGKTYAGFPLFEHKTWLKLQAKISKLLK